jgi:hypothetical protein
VSARTEEVWLTAGTAICICMRESLLRSSSVIGNSSDATSMISEEVKILASMKQGVPQS